MPRIRSNKEEEVICDKGPWFIPDVIQNQVYCLGNDQALIPVCHPQANMVERKNRDLKTRLAIVIGNEHPSWPEKLSSIRFAMHTVACSSNGYSVAYTSSSAGSSATQTTPKGTCIGMLWPLVGINEAGSRAAQLYATSLRGIRSDGAALYTEKKERAGRSRYFKNVCAAHAGLLSERGALGQTGARLQISVYSSARWLRSECRSC